jgi:hypothetical protein
MALLHSAAKLSSTSNIAWPLPITTRGAGQLPAALLSREAHSGLRLPQRHPGLFRLDRGGPMVPSGGEGTVASLSPAGLVRVGGVRAARAPGLAKPEHPRREPSPVHTCVR